MELRRRGVDSTPHQPKSRLPFWPGHRHQPLEICVVFADRAPVGFDRRV